MEEFYYSNPIDDTTSLCISILTQDDFEMMESDWDDLSEFGLFLFLSRKTTSGFEREVLAKFTSEQEATQYAAILSAQSPCIPNAQAA